MSSYRVDLLGQPGYWRADSTFVPLERGLALALAYLALEGPASRADLAALLWPDSEETRRDQSLRALVYKLRKGLGRGAVVAPVQGMLSLSDDLIVTVDAAYVRAAFLRRDWAGVIAASPHLLDGVREDKDSELGAWLERQRAGFRFRHAAALGEEAERLNEEGRSEEALALASRRLRLDPYNDAVCLQVMDLHLQLGDRIGALHVCEDYCLALQYGLGEEPSQTLKDRLADLQKGGIDSGPIGPPRRVPLHCPHLVGREAAWGQLKDAWERRIPIVYVSASAGLGKSRLMTEFVHQQVGHLFFRCPALPGDAKIRFGSKVHTIRKILRDFPTIEAELEPWVRRQLGRIVPELSAGAEGLGFPKPDDPELVEANRWLFQALGRKVSAIVFDDGQFLDNDTIALGLALESRLERLVEAGDFPVILVGLRPGQLPPEQERTLRQRADMGHAAWIDLDPLAPEAIRQMLSAFGIPGLERHAGELVAASGGSPYLLHELARQAASAVGPGDAVPADFDVMSCARTLFAHKVKRLSAEALLVARLILLAGGVVSAAALATAAELSPDQLAACFRELDQCHLFQCGTFTSPAAMAALLQRITDLRSPHPPGDSP